ncbi:hypothetical protein SS50377_25697 [Spironucleus salmonicida]|uniref:Uncharacterized protein n=1 Tax=Spironucleus salmonicida TaxID=348837 RepID=A0A9P8LNS7_9EUKA|nr:hypothetical protein SS50377_25697 [Spironucleus salmonicida]
MNSSKNKSIQYQPFISLRERTYSRDAICQNSDNLYKLIIGGKVDLVLENQPINIQLQHYKSTIALLQEEYVDNLQHKDNSILNHFYEKSLSLAIDAKVEIEKRDLKIKKYMKLYQ